MKCVLSDDIRVDRFAAFAELAWLESRPELGALCRAAREAGRRVSTEVVQAALPGVSTAGAKNVVAWCNTLALCDASGGLTELGDKVADGDEAPVPEQGVFDFWTVSHPLLGQRALHVDRITAANDGRFENITAIGSPPTKGVVFRSSVDPRNRFLVRAFLPEGGAPTGHRGSTTAHCRVRWTMDFDAGREHFTLDGAIDGKEAPRSIRHEAEQGVVDLAAVLLTWARGPMAAFGRWDAALRRLAVPFDGLTADVQERFQKSLTLPAVEVSGRGSWKSVTLEEVPIGPATAADATRWAMARLDRRLREGRRYRTRGDVRTLFDSLVWATPLEAHEPALSSHDQMLAQYATAPEVFWGLAAPMDLAPDPASLAAPHAGAAEVVQ